MPTAASRETAAGTAAYLDVFGSILAVAKELKGRGYDLGDVDPAQMEAEDLMEVITILTQVLGHKETQVQINIILVIQHQMHLITILVTLEVNISKHQQIRIPLIKIVLF